MPCPGPAALPLLAALAWPHRGHGSALTLSRPRPTAGPCCVRGGGAGADPHARIRPSWWALASLASSMASRRGAAPFGCGSCCAACGPAASRCACVATLWPRIRARTGCALVLPSWRACLLPGVSPHRVSSSHGLDVAQPGQGTRAERACTGFRGIKPFAALTFYSTVPYIPVQSVPQSASTATN